MELFSLGASDKNSVEVTPRDTLASDCMMLILLIDDTRDKFPD